MSLPPNDHRDLTFSPQDAFLPQMLLNKLECLEKCAEVARLRCVPVNSLLYREDMIIRSKALRDAIREGRVLLNP